MKINKLFVGLLAGISLFACSDDNESNPIVQNEYKSVSVVLNGINKPADSRATDPTDVVTSEMVNVNSVLINLTDDNGTVIVSKKVEKSDALNSDWDKLVTSGRGLKFINISQSVSKVYVYGNPGNAVKNNVISTKLADQQGTGVLYYGMDDNLTPVEDEPIEPNPVSGKTYTAQVSITPIVARMQITKISFKNSGSFEFTREISGETKKATVTWNSFTADLIGIYMNSFFNTYNQPGNMTDYLKNLTYDQHIMNGQWIFDTTPAVDAAAYASYNNYVNDAYTQLPTDLAGKAYAFNFFPGTAIPWLHLNLTNVVVDGMTSTDTEVFNPTLTNKYCFANVVKFYKGVTEMTASDFKPGTLYNMELEVIPMLDNDLGNVQYNVLVHVTVEPWVEENITPGFDLEQ